MRTFFLAVFAFSVTFAGLRAEAQPLVISGQFNATSIGADPLSVALAGGSFFGEITVQGSFPSATVSDFQLTFWNTAATPLLTFSSSAAGDSGFFSPWFGSDLLAFSNGEHSLQLFFPTDFDGTGTATSGMFADGIGTDLAVANAAAEAVPEPTMFLPVAAFLGYAVTRRKLIR